MRSLIAVIRSLLSRARFEREMHEELAQHVQHRADDLVRTGMPHDEAVRQARLEFGAVEAYKEQCRDASGFAPLRVLHGFGGDLRLALDACWRRRCSRSSPSCRSPSAWV
jgi:hypothetical protein